MVTLLKKNMTKVKRTPCFTLVKDHGIYVMSGAAHDKELWDAKAKKFKVAYAKGFDPDQEDLWEKTYAVSGDDFAESVLLTKTQLLNIAKGKPLRIRITPKRIAYQRIRSLVVGRLVVHRSRRNSHLHSYYQTWKGPIHSPALPSDTARLKIVAIRTFIMLNSHLSGLSRQICSPNGAPGSSEPGVSTFADLIWPGRTSFSARSGKNRTKSHEVRTSDRTHETENILIMRPSRSKSYFLIYINEMRKSLLTFII